MLAKFPAALRLVRHAIAAAAALAALARAAADLPAADTVAASPAAGPLTEIRAIRALPAATASQALPVVIRGVITRVTPYEMFLQNGPDAIFVWQETRNAGQQAGDYVEVTGVTHGGHLFPIVRSSRVTLLEHRARPEPQVMPYTVMATGRGDCQWIEVAGTVQTAQLKPDGSATLRILYEGTLLRLEIGALERQGANQLLGARVRVHGVVNGFKTPQRKLIEPVIVCDDTPETFLIEQPGPADIFATPLRSTDTLGDPESSSAFRELVRIAGVVTCQPSPHLIFVRDQAQSLEIRLVDPAAVAVGDRIDAVGFVEMGVIQPVLMNAVVRRVAPGAPPVPRKLRDAAELLQLRNEAELVEVEGEIRATSHLNDGYVILLADRGVTFNVEIGARQVDPGFESPPVGSRVAAVGICQIDRITPPDANQVVAPASVRLHLRSPGELRVLSRPSWWTPQRLFAAVAVLSVFVLGALAWIWTLNRRVRTQTQIILHGARQQATLEERNRIAREFHDTLEQQLAAATFLLDAVDTVVVEQPHRAREGLLTARAMLRHSLEEAQQAVANLRNNELFDRRFGPLIEAAVHERLAATGIKAEFRYDGAWPELDSRVKQHLLRIVQESVTNAVKHAAPQCITVALRSTPEQIDLQVRDDGRGFRVPENLRRDASEFGLIGLHDRAEKIGARLSILSAPQQGTTIAVTLRLDAALT